MIILKRRQADGNYISPAEHEGLHDRDEYVELTRQYNKVVNVDVWRDMFKTYKISSTAFVRQNNKVSKTVKNIYDYATGTTIIATITGTLTRQDGKVTTIVYERDYDVGGV